MTAQLYSYFSQEPLADAYTGCHSKCLDACNGIAVKPRVTATKFPAVGQLESFHRIYATYTNAPWMTSQDMQNLSIVQLYYDTSHYKVLELKQRVTLERLISQMGGVMGVWAGMSCVTLFQLILYFLHGLTQLFIKKLS